MVRHKFLDFNIKTEFYLEKVLFSNQTIKNRKGTLLGLKEDSLNIVYRTLQLGEIQLTLPKSNFGKRTRYTKQYTKDEFDSRKARSSISPNFIHYLDSRVLFECLEHCRKQNIPVFAQHDSFSIPLEEVKTIKEIYLKSLYSIFLDQENPLITFIRNNKEVLDKEDEKLITSLEKRHRELKEKWNTYIPSSHILSP